MNNHNGSIVEHDNYWELSFKEKTVTGFFIDYSFALNIYHKIQSVYVTIHSQFNYYDNELGTDNTIDPNNLTSILPVLNTFRKDVEKILMYKNGDLCVQFTDESTIIVKADEEYEAWKISDNQGSEGILVLSLPNDEGLELYYPDNNNS